MLWLSFSCRYCINTIGDLVCNIKWCKCFQFRWRLVRKLIKSYPPWILLDGTRHVDTMVYGSWVFLGLFLSLVCAYSTNWSTQCLLYSNLKAITISDMFSHFMALLDISAVMSLVIYLKGDLWQQDKNTSFTTLIKIMYDDITCAFTASSCVCNLYMTNQSWEDVACTIFISEITVPIHNKLVNSI